MPTLYGKTIDWLRQHSQVLGMLQNADVGKNQRSIVLTLLFGDIMLINRNDWGHNVFYSPGNIFWCWNRDRRGAEK